MWQVPLEISKEKTECSFLQTDALVFFTQIFMNWLQLSELRTWTIRWNLEKCSRKSGCLFVGKWSFIKDNIYRTRGERYSSPKRKILFLSFIDMSYHSHYYSYAIGFLFIFNFPPILDHFAWIAESWLSPLKMDLISKINNLGC